MNHAEAADHTAEINASQRSWKGEMFHLLVENVTDYAIFSAGLVGSVDTGFRLRLRFVLPSWCRFPQGGTT
jgi:hypothetical protein